MHEVKDTDNEGDDFAVAADDDDDLVKTNYAQFVANSALVNSDLKNSNLDHRSIRTSSAVQFGPRPLFNSDLFVLVHSDLDKKLFCSIHPNIKWLYFQAHFERHGVLILGKSPMKWRQRPDMTTAMDSDAKPQINKSNSKTLFHLQIQSEIMARVPQ